MKTNLIVILLLLPLMDYAQQLTDNNYRIYSVKQQKEVPLSAIITDMENYDVLIYGEQHNDSVTHYLEKTIFEMMYAQYNSNLALSMEMFDRDVQPVMNEYLAGYIREKHFKKDARVWSNYSDYRAMVEFSKEKNLPVICANAASRYTNLAGRKGIAELMKLPKESKANFAPLPYDTATGDYHNKLWELSGHSITPVTQISDTLKVQTPPPMMMGNFNLVVAQSLWDATMAFSIAEFKKKNPEKKIFHINGRFHSDEGFAVVMQLKKYSPKTKPLIISSTSDDSFPNIDWSPFKKLGDYIIITDPKVPVTYEE